MQLNKDVNKRDQIIFGQDYDRKYYRGGIRDFSRMPVATLQILVDEGFADPEEAQNDAPTIGEILKYADGNENVFVSGYAVSIHRDDYRVSVDAVTQLFETERDRADFAIMFRLADEFDISDERGGYAWFD